MNQELKQIRNEKEKGLVKIIKFLAYPRIHIYNLNYI